MARGNWSKYHPKVRCRMCGAVIKGEVKRINDIPHCTNCYNRKLAKAGGH